MDLLLQQALPIFFLLLTIIIFSRKIRAGDGKTGHRQLAPAPGWKLPVIGHLHHFLTSRQLPHRLLRELARKHGDMIRLDLGEIQHVLVSSAEAAKEVMRTHDIKFAQRPSHPSLDKVMYGGIDLIHAPYGDYWRQLRRIATLELLTAKRVDSLRRVREAEVRRLVTRITERQVAAAAAGSTIDLTKMLFNLTYRIISMSTFGDVSKEPEEFMKVAEELVEYAGGFKISFLFPSCGLVQRLFGTTEWLDGVHKVTDRLMESMIGQHRSKRALEKQKGTTSEEEEDLLDVLLRVQEDDCTLGFHLSTDAIKAFLLDIFLAGSETPATLIEWTMAEMIRNPEVMHKAQSEVRKVFGERGKVEESKIHELTYLKLVIKETLRLHTPTPLVLPRECREECRIFGYDIPLKTRVLVNVWAISRDPRYWGVEAEKFLPERFLDEKVNFRGTDFEFLPFGAGRRMCPGISFGLAVVELLLANLLFHFDWKLPGGAEPESLNMDEQFGVSLRKKNHLELIPVVQYNPLPPA
ncbi:unnamed protein product [Linum tenue]|uniref:Cytochrome P450 n=1 Tax=Linum tenue TaxID=586396 RepID=A0AAV0M0D0_9ROSI|nr:unnamed protein product [Linum tenue]